MIGVYYYPEQWPEDQWERDIQNIKKMGMKHIHMSEFAWIHLEPEQGRYNFTWLDSAIGLAEKNSLDVILCTPTATPPIWMSHNHPDSLMVRETGRRVTHGSRAHRCVNSPVFNNFAESITKKIGNRYGKMTCVRGWQLDNEIGHYGNAPCFCPHCLIKYREYLEEKYQDIQTMNKAWGGDFWSQNHQNFDQVQFPNAESLPYLPNEHALLDFKRFFSISLSRFLNRQEQILRKTIHKNAWITHNFMKDDPFHYPGHLKKGLDLYTLTIYPVAGIFTGEPGREIHRIGDSVNIAFSQDLMRSYNGRWGIMEQQPGQVNWGPCNLRPWPGSTRLWLWTAIAHGAEILDTYRYRQPLSGAEQYHEGIVGTDGVTPTRGGQDFTQVAHELDRLDEHLTQPGTTKQLKAGFICDWDSFTALSIHPQSVRFDPNQSIQHFYGAIKKSGFDIEFIHKESAPNPEIYPVVCIALVDFTDDSHISRWKHYIKKGGHLIVSLRTATRNTNGHFPEMTYGERITSLTGAVISGYDVMPEGHQGNIRLNRSGVTITWDTWADQYKPDKSSRITAEFSDQFYKGEAAAFKKAMGKGTVTVIGFDQKEGIETLISESLHEEFKDLVTLPENTLFRIRGSLGIFLNYSDNEVTIPGSLYQNAKIISGTSRTEAAGVTLIQYKTDG